MAEKVDRYGSDIFDRVGEAVKGAINNRKNKKKLKYPYNEEELKDTKKWKDNALKSEIIKLRSHINKLDIESNEFDTLSTELAKLQKEAENRGLFLPKNKKPIKPIKPIKEKKYPEYEEAELLKK